MRAAVDSLGGSDPPLSGRRRLRGRQALHGGAEHVVADAAERSGAARQQGHPGGRRLRAGGCRAGTGALAGGALGAAARAGRRGSASRRRWPVVLLLLAILGVAVAGLWMLRRQLRPPGSGQYGGRQRRPLRGVASLGDSLEVIVLWRLTEQAPARLPTRFGWRWGWATAAESRCRHDTEHQRPIRCTCARPLPARRRRATRASRRCAAGGSPGSAARPGNTSAPRLSRPHGPSWPDSTAPQAEAGGHGAPCRAHRHPHRDRPRGPAGGSRRRWPVRRVAAAEPGAVGVDRGQPGSRFPNAWVRTASPPSPSSAPSRCCRTVGGSRPRTPATTPTANACTRRGSGSGSPEPSVR